MNINQAHQLASSEQADSIIKLYGSEAMLSVVKAWRYSAPDKELERELDMIIRTVESAKI